MDVTGYSVPCQPCVCIYDKWPWSRLDVVRERLSDYLPSKVVESVHFRCPDLVGLIPSATISDDLRRCIHRSGTIPSRFITNRPRLSSLA